MCSYLVDFRIESDGQLTCLSEVPEIRITTNQLSLDARALIPAPNPALPAAEVSWNFGDGSPMQQGEVVQHTFERSGSYEVTLRVVRNGRLSEFRVQVAVSEQHSVGLPVTAFPQLSTQTGAPTGQTRIVTTLRSPPSETLTALWRVLPRTPVQTGESVSFDLPPGSYTLSFTAVRQLRAHIFCTQRYLPTAVIPLNALRVVSNRRFDEDGSEIEAQNRNDLAVHLFGESALSPADMWTIEILPRENPFLMTVTSGDYPELDLGRSDLLLSLEYEVSEG